MKYTFTELMTELLRRNNISAYCTQKQGTASWMWMGGEYNSMVHKDSCTIENIYSLRKPFRKIKAATIQGYIEPKPFNVTVINKILENIARKWSPKNDIYGHNTTQSRRTLQS